MDELGAKLGTGTSAPQKRRKSEAGVNQVAGDKGKLSRVLNLGARAPPAPMVTRRAREEKVRTQ